LCSVQVVHDDADDFGLRVRFIDQPLHLVRKVNHRALVSDRHMPEACLWLNEEEQIARPVSLILIIKARRLSGSLREGLARLANQLLAGFIEVDLRALRIVRLGIEFQHVFHARDKFSRDLRNAPLLFQVRLEFVFLSTRRTASYEYDSASLSCTTRSASNASVQR